MNLGNRTNKTFVGRSIFVVSSNYNGLPSRVVGRVGKIVAVRSEDSYSVRTPGSENANGEPWYIHVKDMRLLGSVLNG